MQIWKPKFDDAVNAKRVTRSAMCPNKNTHEERRRTSTRNGGSRSRFEARALASFRIPNRITIQQRKSFFFFVTSRKFFSDLTLRLEKYLRKYEYRRYQWTTILPPWQRGGYLSVGHLYIYKKNWNHNQNTPHYTMTNSDFQLEGEGYTSDIDCPTFSSQCRYNNRYNEKKWGWLHVAVIITSLIFEKVMWRTCGRIKDCGAFSQPQWLPNTWLHCDFYCQMLNFLKKSYYFEFAYILSLN